MKRCDACKIDESFVSNRFISCFTLSNGVLTKISENLYYQYSFCNECKISLDRLLPTTYSFRDVNKMLTEKFNPNNKT